MFDFLKTLPRVTLVDAIVRPKEKYSATLLNAHGAQVFERLGLVAAFFEAEYLLTATSDFEFVDANQLIVVNPVEHIVSSDQLELGNWAIPYFQLDEVWSQTQGEGVCIAVLDSGIDAQHPCLAGNVLDRFVVTDDLGSWAVQNGVSTDSGYHGTHVASIAVGHPADGIRTGVAPRAKAISIQILTGATGTIRRALAGLEAVANMSDVKVVNLSFELVGKSIAFIQALSSLTSFGKIVVVASGNGGMGKEASPGNYPSSICISVGACTQDEKIWSYSNGGVSHWNQAPLVNIDVAVPTVSAPGKEIIAAVPGNTYKMLSGTSMATPHVTGTAALVASLRPNIELHEMQGLLTKTSKDLGDMAWDPRYGAGIINIRALLAALSNQ